MSKRASGSPRRPRNPAAKAVRSPQYRQRVVPDKRWQARIKPLPDTEDGGEGETLPDGEVQEQEQDQGEERD